MNIKYNENVEGLSLSCSNGGNVKQHSYSGKKFDSFLQSQSYITILNNSYALGIFPKETKTYV